VGEDRGEKKRRGNEQKGFTLRSVQLKKSGGGSRGTRKKVHQRRKQGAKKGETESGDATNFNTPGRIYRERQKLGPGEQKVNQKRGEGAWSGEGKERGKGGGSQRQEACHKEFGPWERAEQEGGCRPVFWGREEGGRWVGRKEKRKRSNRERGKGTKNGETSLKYAEHHVQSLLKKTDNNGKGGVNGEKRGKRKTGSRRGGSRNAHWPLRKTNRHHSGSRRKRKERKKRKPGEEGTRVRLSSHQKEGLQ